MYKKSYLLKVLLSISVLFVISCQSRDRTKLRVAVAANMSYAVKDINALFTQKFGTAVEVSIGSSGRITGQIMNGAPYDVFLSANMVFPDTLYTLGFTENKPTVYALGNLVFWSKYPVANWQSALTSVKYKKIAIGAAGTAPYGFATKQLLRAVGLYDSLMPKMVFGESVGQVNRYLFSSAVDGAFTSKSSEFGLPKGVAGFWYQTEPALYEPIKQGGVVLRNSANKKIANQYLNFMLSDTIQAVLVKFGYSPVK